MKSLLNSIFTFPTILVLLFLVGCGDNLLGDQSFVDNSFSSAPTDTVPDSSNNNSLVLSSGSFQYADGTYAINCLEYRNSPSYGNEGTGSYWIDPDGNDTNIAFEAYCDMTTDGGGWTLIGRGREGWNWNNSGSNISNVHLNIGTTSAFTPAFYASTVVDDIAGSINMSSLSNGLRIRRAADTTGSTYQEVKWYFSTLTLFSWTFESTYTLSDVTINEVSLGGSNSRDSVSDHGNDANRIFTWGWASHGSQRGFSYGNTVTEGTNSATNYLWENGSEGHSIPYTEVYIRQ